MVLAAVIIWVTDREHEVLVLEASEIALFGVFWIVQTAELWSATAELRASSPPRWACGVRPC